MNSYSYDIVTKNKDGEIKFTNDCKVYAKHIFEAEKTIIENLEKDPRLLRFEVLKITPITN
tara:strand:+ start:89470 stop:89652 length:183 start_codon:yes stop_codon:yes gene_type:complete